MTTVQWANSYEDSLQKAREDKKPLFLDFFKHG
jgi:hypothetical protein